MGVPLLALFLDCLHAMKASYAMLSFLSFCMSSCDVIIHFSSAVFAFIALHIIALRTNVHTIAFR